MFKAELSFSEFIVNTRVITFKWPIVCAKLMSLFLASTLSIFIRVKCLAEDPMELSTRLCVTIYPVLLKSSIPQL